MKKPFNFKDNKILKPITIVTLLYSVLMFINYFGNFVAIFKEPENPLIPKFLPYYAAFASYFMLPFFGMLIFICVRNLKSKFHNFKSVYFVFGLAFLFFLFRWRIHEFILRFNPYGV